MTARLDPSPRLKGMSFTRAAIALALHKNAPDAAIDFASNRWGPASAPVSFLRAVATGATADDWLDAGSASPAAEFFQAVQDRSLLGRLPLRRVPFDTRCLSFADPTTAAWVAEGKATPISSTALDFSELEPFKVGAATITTREALKATGGLAEQNLRLDLIRACVQEVDRAFVDPANTGVAGAKPAAITAGVTAIDGLTFDSQTLLEGFSGDPSEAVMVMSPATALALNGTENPDIGARGGDLAGLAVETSMAVPAGIVVLIDPAGIAFAGGGGEVRTSEHATVEMLDGSLEGNSVTPTPTDIVSLFQTNAVALGASISANWTVIRPGSVTYSDLGAT